MHYFFTMPAYADEVNTVLNDKDNSQTDEFDEKQKTRKQDTVKLTPVVVVATRTEKDPELAPASTSIVTKKDMELRDVKAIDDAVNDLPGVFVNRGLLNASATISMRGISGYQRNLIMMDGITMNDPYSGQPRIGGGYYPEDLEKVEVVRGPASSLYGGYAMGGVVNYVTKTPEKRDLFCKAGYGSGFNRGEAMDDLRRAYISYGDKLWDKLSIFASYGRQDTNGYPPTLNIQSTKPSEGISGWETTERPTGSEAYLIGDKGDRTWWDQGFTLKSEYSFSDDTKLGFLLTRQDYEYNNDQYHTYLADSNGNSVVEYDGVTESSFLNYYGGKLQDTYAVKFNTRIFGDIAIKANLSMFDIKKDWYVTVLSGATWNGGPGYVSDASSKAYNADIQFSMPIFGKQILTFGGMYRKGEAEIEEKNLTRWNDESSTTSLRYEEYGKSNTYSLFIQDEVGILDNLTAYIGVRGDWWETFDGWVNQTDTEDYPKEYNSKSASYFSPKFALVYQPYEKTKLRGTIGKAFRPPTLYELYRTWTTNEGVTYAGNPDLDPEKSLSWDIGIHQHLWKGANASLTYFENYLEDLIYRNTVSSTYLNRINVGKAESKGFEFEITQKVSEELSLNGNVTYTDSKIKENEIKPDTVGKRLTNTPLWMANIGVTYELGAFAGSLSGRYMDKWYSYDDNSDEVDGVYGSYDPHFIADIKVSYQLKKYGKMALCINNLFDEDYYWYSVTPRRSWFLEYSIDI